MPEVLTQVDPEDSIEKFKQGRELSGPELDKATALAFGVEPSLTWEIFNDDESATMIGFEREAAAIKWWDEHPSVHPNHHIGTLEHWPAYSADVNLALSLLERVASVYAISKTDALALASAPYSASIVHGPAQAFAYAPTIGEAICRAALKAVEDKS